MPRQAKQAITKGVIAEAIAKAKGAGKAIVVCDAGCSRLRLWVGKGGTIRWQRREGDKTVILGDAATITIGEARDMCRGPVVLPVPRSAKTVGAYLASYVEARRRDWTKSTFRQTPRILRAFLAELLELPLSAITRDWTIDRQQELLAGGMAASTVSIHTKIVQAFTNWLYQHEHLAANPYRHRLKRLRVEDHSKAVDERDKYLLEAQCAVDDDLAMACCVMLALNCGLRPGETQALRPAHIQLDQGVIYIAAAGAKTAMARNAVLPASLVQFLRERLGRLRKDYPFKVGDFGLRWHALQRRARLYERYQFRHLRHGFGSLALARGIDIKTVSTAMGHKTTRTTETYLHSNLDRLRRVAQLMEGSPRAWLAKPVEEEAEAGDRRPA